MCTLTICMLILFFYNCFQCLSFPLNSFWIILVILLSQLCRQNWIGEEMICKIKVHFLIFIQILLEAPHFFTQLYKGTPTFCSSETEILSSCSCYPSEVSLYSKKRYKLIYGMWQLYCSSWMHICIRITSLQFITSHVCYVSML